MGWKGATMTEIALQAILEDFKAWTGGTTPSDHDEIQEYIDVSAPSSEWSGEETQQVVRFLAEHINDPI